MSGLYSKKQLREVILLSMTQVDRLEKVGKFPKRIALGDHINSRCGWLKDEVHAWLQKRVDDQRAS